MTDAVLLLLAACSQSVRLVGAMGAAIICIWCSHLQYDLQSKKRGIVLQFKVDSTLSAVLSNLRNAAGLTALSSSCKAALGLQLLCIVYQRGSFLTLLVKLMVFWTGFAPITSCLAVNCADHT
jgi:hypothetical protein